MAEALIESLRPIRERFEQLISDPAELDRILAIGAEQARAVAEPKARQVLERVGFVLAQ